ncbi:sulfonate transport system ATP-binding protein [Brevinema andersonii]|uniref:Sulfonate transport system ATP-binding protein n=1 Tax=Brevinema andersonii TaxID=34097 RepID=A0A1I1D306_BREAD|nr:ATP-binding cassette domain-containing protein [Brevinema andersonii]SFB66983.1 sulfonate transport system ATP-binding protein [Brevinema andersonii]
MSNIDLTNITKVFKVDNHDFYALNNLSISIPTNQITTIVGKSGSGKTTLLRIINKLTTPTSGHLVIPHYTKTATVFQETRLFPWLTVAENIMFFGEKDYEYCNKLLEILELTSFKDLYPHQISGGMAQKVALGRALHYKPNILLMDEPFAALDYFTRHDMQKKLLYIATLEQVGIIFITHNIDEAVFLADKIIILSQGRVKQTIENNLTHAERNSSIASSELKKIILNKII